MSPYACGEKAGGHRLTWEKVGVIRSMAQTGWTLRQIAAVFAVAHSTIWKIVIGRTWRVTS